MHGSIIQNSRNYDSYYLFEVSEMKTYPKTYILYIQLQFESKLIKCEW